MGDMHPAALHSSAGSLGHGDGWERGRTSRSSCGRRRGHLARVHCPRRGARYRRALASAMSQDEAAVDAERQHTVLVVEDDRAIREMIEFWLQEHAIQVITAQDGAEAIAIIDAQPAP